MSEAAVLNRVRRSFYLDSVALMRLSQCVSTLAGVETAALMIGSESNKGVMEEAGLLVEEGRAAGANDLVIAVRAESLGAGEAALAEAELLLDSPSLRGGEVQLLDVRNDVEFETAKIEGAQLVTQELVDEILSRWDKTTRIVLYCHHGVRSLQAAQYLAQHGFQNVRSMAGGIDAWSQQVDATVPRY